MNRVKRQRVGLVGCGKVAALHAAAMRESAHGEVVAACGRSMEKARQFGEPRGMRAYDRVGEMVDRERLDAVIVCTPHPRHAAAAMEAATSGAHVLVEKPLAVSLDDCDAMIAAADKAGVTLGTVSQRRFYPPCRRMREAIDAGKIGRPVLGAVTMLGWRDEAYYRSDPWRGTWAEEGGGVLVNQAPHQLDLLLWFMGEIDEVFGYWGNLNHPYIEVEDTAVAVVRFKNGGLGNILVSNAQNPALFGKVKIHGSNGASIGVQTDGGAMFIAGMSKIEEPPVNDCWTICGESELLDAWREEDTQFFRAHDAMEYFMRMQDEDFLMAVAEGRPPLVTAEDGRRTVELFTAIYQSQRAGGPARLPLGSSRTDG